MIKTPEGVFGGCLKATALALAVIVVVSFALSEAVILTFAAHSHESGEAGERCAVCDAVRGAENLIKQICAAAGGGATAFTGALFAGAALCVVLLSLFGVQTPIDLRNRMNN
jgi:CDP-diglyceride synthetase